MLPPGAHPQPHAPRRPQAEIEGFNRATYRRTNHTNLHIHGYKEEGTTTTPFDMCVLNHIDRFGLVKDVIRRVPGLSEKADHMRQVMDAKHAEHRRHIAEHGVDLPEVEGWHWQGTPKPSGQAAGRDTTADNV